MINVPREIEAQIIDAQVKMLQLEAGVRFKVDDLLKQVQDELVARLSDADPTRPIRTAYQKERFNKLLAEVKTLLNTSYANVAKQVSKELEAVAEYSNSLATKSVNSVLGVEIIKASLTAEQLSTIVSYNLIEGAPSAEWWAKQAVDTRTAFANEIRKGMAQGETVGDLIARIRGKRAYLDRPAYRGIMDIARRNAAALVRTSVISVSNAAHLDMYRQNTDVVRGIQWISTLDSRTTRICQALDGLTWDLDLKPIGHDHKFPGATAHWGCRSTQIPLLRDWTELITDKRIADALNAFDKGTRASIGGQVPDTTSYESWLQSRTDEQQIEILGKGRFDLFKQGKINLVDLIDQTGNSRTLNQLSNL